MDQHVAVKAGFYRKAVEVYEYIPFDRKAVEVYEYTPRPCDIVVCYKQCIVSTRFRSSIQILCNSLTALVKTIRCLNLYNIYLERCIGLAKTAKVALSNYTTHTKHYLQKIHNRCCNLGQTHNVSCCSNACVENDNKLSFHSLYKVSVLFFLTVTSRQTTLSIQCIYF